MLDFCITFFHGEKMPRVDRRKIVPKQKKEPVPDTRPKVDRRVWRMLEELDHYRHIMCEFDNGYEYWQWRLFALWHLGNDYALGSPLILHGPDLSYKENGNQWKPFRLRQREYNIIECACERDILPSIVTLWIATGNRRKATQAVQQELSRRTSRK
ncbi:MAG: hypothetical protein Q8P30_01730 [Candidatus Uhrbacteria bacterium]|nr:hypothetical protein [Candidatus Uhrbacteria bacterium]